MPATDCRHRGESTVLFAAEIFSILTGQPLPCSPAEAQWLQAVEQVECLCSDGKLSVHNVGHCYLSLVISSPSSALLLLQQPFAAVAASILANWSKVSPDIGANTTSDACTNLTFLLPELLFQASEHAVHLHEVL